MKRELSILIPVYNTVCTSIVETLLRQCEQASSEVADFCYEIIVADDCSPEKTCIEANGVINKMPCCQFIEKEENTGSAATRNFLATQSHYRWLLFLDCDMQIVSRTFIADYLQCDFEGVINGGICIGEGSESNLRYLYEKHCEPMHTAEMRSKRPYHSFRSTNFIIGREMMLSCPFDERFKKSGYEDVIFGKHLRDRKATIHHIDNPTQMTDFEPNPDYVAKIERSMRTLHQFRNELRGYSRILTIDQGIHIGAVRWLLRLWHRLLGPLERRNLCGKHPRLRLFDLYRLGYYMTLTNND